MKMKSCQVMKIQMIDICGNDYRLDCQYINREGEIKAVSYFVIHRIEDCIDTWVFRQLDMDDWDDIKYIPPQNIVKWFREYIERNES